MWWLVSPANPFDFMPGPPVPLLPALLVVLVVAAVRWALWPREVHAGHTRPHTLFAGRLLAAALVALPALALILLVRNIFG